MPLASVTVKNESATSSWIPDSFLTSSGKVLLANLYRGIRAFCEGVSQSSSRRNNHDSAGRGILNPVQSVFIFRAVSFMLPPTSAWTPTA